MTNKRIPIEDFSENDVIAFKSGEHTMRIDRFINKFKSRFSSSRGALSYHNILENQDYKIVKDGGSDHWFNRGQECEILAIGASQWRKGHFRVKLSLEFIPDEEPENGNALNHFRDNQDNEEESNWPPEPMND